MSVLIDMSVLIKNLAMPKEGCRDCPFTNRLSVCDYCLVTHKDVTCNAEQGKKPTDCPLVEVVRCKDCKFHEEAEHGMVYCPNYFVSGWVPNDFFCADGKRKEVEE